MDVAGRAAVDDELVVDQLLELDRSGEDREVDGKQRRPDRVGEDLLDRPAVLLHGGVHGDVGLGGQQRGEERKTLDVVPVQVADEAGTAKRHLGRHRPAEVAQTGSEVEQDRIGARDVDRHARRVAAVADDVGSVARRRPTDAVKRHLHARGGGVVLT